MIYLDHNATTPLRPAVRAAMAPFLADAFGNASSAHRLGGSARVAVEEARAALARVIGARPREIVFTSGGTESNNLALFGAIADPTAAHVIVAPIEHSSVLEPVRELERRGADVTWLPVDREGLVDPADVAAALRPATALVSVGWANNEIGAIQPIRAIADACHARGVPLHVDAVQAFGKIPITADGIDLCAVSAHKIGGPKGVGALVVRDGVRLRPLVFGGGQERGRRAGTENVAGIVGFGAAVGSIADWRETGTALREQLWAGLAAVGDVRRNGACDACLPNTLNVSFAAVRGEALVAALDLEGVAVSVGSACAAGSGEPSHVLRAIGLTEDEARDGVRFSLGVETTEAEIAAAVEIVAAVIGRMRAARAKQVVNA